MGKSLGRVSRQGRAPWGILAVLFGVYAMVSCGPKSSRNVPDEMPPAGSAGTPGTGGAGPRGGVGHNDAGADGDPLAGAPIGDFAGGPPIGDFGGAPPVGSFGGAPYAGDAGAPYGGDAGAPWVGHVGGVGGDDFGGYSGEGWLPQTEGFECEQCEVVASSEDLRAIATTPASVYWVDHGSFDALGNHQSDGALFERTLNGGEPGAIAQQLEGPTDLAVSSSYAYVTLDESSAANGKGGLARIPIAGGAAQLLQAIHPRTDVPPLRGHFVTGGGQAFWLKEAVIYQVAETAQGVLAPLRYAAGVREIFGDASWMYLYDTAAVHQLSYAGGEPTLLQTLDPGDGDYRDFSVSGDFIYATEQASSARYLVRMPKAGGPMKRVAGITAAHWQLLVQGDRWIWDPPSQDFVRRRIVEQSISNMDASFELATALPWGRYNYTWGPMAMSSAGLFFENADTLYQVPYAQ